MKRQIEFLTRPFAALALCVAMALCLAGCAGQQSEPYKPAADGSAVEYVDVSDTSNGVAATVNGTEIGENAVTEYLNNVRYAQGLQDDGDWGQWIFDSGYTMDALRSETVDYFVNRELIRQAADERGITVSDDEIEEAYNRALDSFGEDGLARELDSEGLSDAIFRDDIRVSLLQEKLSDQVIGDVQVTDEQVLASMKSYYPNEVSSDATSLDELNQAKVSNVRQMLENSAKQTEFAQWLSDYKDQCDVQTNSMPDDAPYIVDLTSYEDAANAQTQSAIDSSSSANKEN